jgi:hypothetical protein
MTCQEHPVRQLTYLERCISDFPYGSALSQVALYAKLIFIFIVLSERFQKVQH